MSSRTPRVGDIVLIPQGIAVIRYFGNVDWDEESKYFGVELKGPSISGGHNGTYNGKKYFTVSGGDGRGIFVKTSNIIRIISSEEILEKLAEIYDILKGRKGHSHFIDRARYDDLLSDHNKLQDQYQDKLTEVEDLNTDLAILKEQINMMKGTLHDKIDETAKIHDKVVRAEKKLGTRLSQFDLESVKQKLESDNNDIENDVMNIPDYSRSINNTKKKGHTKQRSTTEIELDQLHDDFSDIAKTVQAYGQKNMDITGPTHYRRYSNTTKQILEQHKRGQQPNQYSPNNNINGKNKTSGHRARGSMKIGDIVDEHGIDYDSEEEQQKLERDSENEEDDTQQKRKPKTRLSRESRQLDDTEINNGGYFNDEQEIKERESNEEDDDNNQTKPKRNVKSRASRESRQLDDVEVSYGDNNAPPKRKAKSRSSRDSRQLDGDDIDNYGSEDEDEDEEEYDEDDHFMEVQDDALGNNMQIDANVKGKQVKRNKARGSFQVSQPVLSASILETHNEHQLEEEAGQINGPRDAPKHKKSDTMTSDSSAYRAFMSVD